MVPHARIQQAQSSLGGQRSDMLLDEGPLVHAQLAQTPERSCPQLLLHTLSLHTSQCCSDECRWGIVGVCFKLASICHRAMQPDIYAAQRIHELHLGDSVGYS